MYPSLTPFSPPTEAWFRGLFAGPTAVQREGWARLRAADGGPGGNALLVAPTGSGKTLAAFLAAIDRLMGLPVNAPPGVRVLYVSPLKALVHDVEKNLQVPLRGIAAAARAEGRALRPVRVDMRTGDTPQRERRQFRKDPGDVLVTTPESLFLLLGSEAREALRSVETVIVDEIHALCETKRGVHLALSLERLDELVGRRVQRVGLSATVRPLSAVARFLGGEQPVEVVDTHAPPRLDLRVEAFLTDGGRLGAAPPTRSDGSAGGAAPGPATEASFPLDRGGGWQATYERILELIRAHRSTLIFVNYRRLCERMALRLNEMAGEELVRAHHGSVAREQRLGIEEALKQGQLRALVATGTLELGIDMGAIDLVVLVESPGSAARGLQRVGRAGHQVGGTSIGRIFPRFRADLVECAVVADAMRRGELEALRIPRNCLDVLAQQVVAMVADRDWGVDELYRCVTRASPYTTLPREAYERVLAMLDGAWASGPLVNLSPRLFWDRTEGTLRARRGAAALGRANAGAIPDRGNFGVFLGKGGPRVGELDEEMVYESRKGDTFLLGASTWRIEEITRDQVLVSPAPGQPGRMPFWRGDSPGRPLELGRRIGAFVRELTELEPGDAVRRLTMSHALDPDAADSLLELLREQRAVTGSLPTDRAVTVETWRDESGDLRVNLLTPFGARVHAPWAIAIEATLGRVLGTPVQTLYGDDGITLRLAEADTRPDVSLLLPAPEAVEDLLLERVADTPLFGHRFRENAARALLLPRNAPGRRTPLWQQRIRAQNLLATVKGWPDFPILQETWRECLQDVFDLDGLREVLGGIQAGEIRVDVVDTRLPSPLARSLAWRWVATWLYELDGPAAERRAQVLALDRALLDALLGREAWTELLDPATLRSVAAELQRLPAERRARDAAGLLDVLRRLGDLTEAELAHRADGPAPEWTEALLAAGRVAEVELAGGRRWIAAEDLPLYEHALGARLLRGAAAPRPTPLERAPLLELVLRRAATLPLLRASDLAERWALPPGAFDAALAALGETGLIQSGVYQRGEAPAWAHPAVLQRLKRRALEGAREEVKPVPGATYAELLGRWHGLGGAGAPERRLGEAVERLEGAPLPFLDLEARILPARVPGYRPGMLDELGASGELVWVGCRPLGDTDGRIRLFRREHLPSLWRPPEAPRPGGPAGAVLDALEAGGAQFLVELQGALGRAGRRLAAPELLDLLWALTWDGLVTNDTFQVLRRRGQPGPAGGVGGGGRWFPAARLLGEAPSPERRALAWAEVALRRHAVVDPGPAAAVEELDGGGGALYPPLRALEDAGKARRGAFVEGLGAASFAWPAAIEALRRGGEPATRVLAATDPAQPWGGVLPWPLPGARRAGGARVVLVRGACVLWLDRGGRSLLLAPGEEEPRRAALKALADDAVRTRASVRVERVNGEDADPLAPLLRAAGFSRDPGGRGWSPPF